MLARTPAVGSRAQSKHIEALVAAGFHGQAALTTLLTLKLAGAVLAAPALFGLAGWVLSQRLSILQWPCLAIGLLGGWIFPDMVLAYMAVRRRSRIEQAIPDALDLLVICAQAGLSLSQAIEEVSRDLQRLSPETAEEFAMTASEMRVMTDRGAALENLGKRTGLSNLRALIATLNQSIKFGTPLSEALRVFAAEMRAARVARLEERAARLPVLLAMPLIGLIMPSLLLLIGTPVGLRILDSVRAVFPQLF